MNGVRSEHRTSVDSPPIASNTDDAGLPTAKSLSDLGAAPTRVSGGNGGSSWAGTGGACSVLAIAG